MLLRLQTLTSRYERRRIVAAIALAVLMDVRNAYSIPGEESEESYINLTAYLSSASTNFHFNLHLVSHSLTMSQAPIDVPVQTNAIRVCYYLSLCI